MNILTRGFIPDCESVQQRCQKPRFVWYQVESIAFSPPDQLTALSGQLAAELFHTLLLSYSERLTSLPIPNKMLKPISNAFEICCAKNFKIIAICYQLKSSGSSICCGISIAVINRSGTGRPLL